MQILKEKNMDPDQITIREISKKDNPDIASIIRSSLKEFGANKQGTVYYDPTTDALFEMFNGTSNSKYFITEYNGQILGGGGIYPSAGLPAGTCELVKMYLLPEARGLGLGKALINKAIEYAKEAGYKNIYIETMPELKQALNIYKKFGFEFINAPLGNTGHFGCDLFMLKKL